MLYLGIQGSYRAFEIALFDQKKCVEHVSYQTAQVSAQFLVLLQDLLVRHKISFSQLSFIAVDQGPGAFTSLRVMIALVNGLAFSKKIALIGVDGLDCLAEEAVQLLSAQKQTIPSYVISLLNAFNKEVYFGIYRLEKNAGNTFPVLCMPQGYEPLQAFLQQVAHLPVDSDEKIMIVGNGAEMYRAEISSVLGDHLYQQPFVLQTCSAVHVASVGLVQWENGTGRTCYQLMPLYLKAQTFAVKK